MNLVEAMTHPGMFGRWFAGPSWSNWLTVLKATAALPMTDAEKVFFRTVAERDPPRHPVRESWFQIGRRGGKDSAASGVTAHGAAMFDQQHRLRPGERALCLCLASDRDQARIIHSYVRSFFDEIPALKAMVRRETATTLELNNGIDLVIGTNNFRAVRGRPIWRVVLDECAFYRSEESASPDIELYRALMPGLATRPGSMLIGISSPYRKAGLLHQKFRDHFGRDDDNVLFVRAPSLVMNPTLDPAIVAEALENDPVAARAEWLAEPRDDISSYVDVALIEAAVDRGMMVRPPRAGVAYASFCDPSGGSRDSFTMAVAHAEGNSVTLDCLVEIKPPFNPTEAVAHIADALRSYQLHRTTGDKYAAGWVIEAFTRCGIRYEHSERDRSALYLDALPLFTAGRARLLDSKRLVTQFASLERRTSPIGKDRVDHGPGGHDDLCNSAGGAMVLALGAAPALWASEALLVNGAPAPMPARCGIIFAVLTAGRRGDAAVVYFAKSGIGGTLTVLDVEAAPLAPVLFTGIITRLVNLAMVTRAEHGARLFATGVLAAEFARLGQRAHIVDALAAEDPGLLAVAAAAHVGAGRVKLVSEVLKKGERFPLGGILAGTAGEDDDDPLKLAALIGITVGLDAGRSLAV